MDDFNFCGLDSRARAIYNDLPILHWVRWHPPHAVAIIIQVCQNVYFNDQKRKKVEGVWKRLGCRSVRQPPHRLLEYQRQIVFFFTVVVVIMKVVMRWLIEGGALSYYCRVGWKKQKKSAFRNQQSRMNQIRNDGAISKNGAWSTDSDFWLFDGVNYDIFALEGLPHCHGKDTVGQPTVTIQLQFCYSYFLMCYVSHVPI